jgi:hypothetical protein
MSLSQQANISQSYTANTNLLEVAFSPQDEVNDDINSSLGFFNIGEYIGDPRLRSSSAEFYPDLNALRNSYFEKYTKNYDLVDFVRLIKFFDNSLFKMIKDFVPARTSFASGIVIKQHILERNKYPQPQVDTNSTIAHYAKRSGSINNGTNLPYYLTKDISVSGTLATTMEWTMNAGTVENPNGGTAGTFEIFNGVNSSPYGPNGTGPENIFNLTQSWYETFPTISGSVSILHDAQDEFYDGEFSGSVLTITTQSLQFPSLEQVNLPQPEDYSLKVIQYYSTGSSASSQILALDELQPFNLLLESIFLNSSTDPKNGEVFFYNVGQLTPVTAGTATYLSYPKYIKIAKQDKNLKLIPEINEINYKLFPYVIGATPGYQSLLSSPLTPIGEGTNHITYKIDNYDAYLNTLPGPSSLFSPTGPYVIDRVPMGETDRFNYSVQSNKSTTQVLKFPNLTGSLNSSGSVIGAYGIISNFTTDNTTNKNLAHYGTRYWNTSSGNYTLENTPNVPLLITSSCNVTVSNQFSPSANVEAYFQTVEIFPNGNIDIIASTQLTFIAQPFSTYNVTHSAQYFPTQDSIICQRMFHPGLNSLLISFILLLPFLMLLF